jgi:lipoprotein signal peptidase
MWYVVIFIFSLLLDQLTKLLACYYAGGVDGVTVKTVIDGFLEFTYYENRDGMMGIFDKVVSPEYMFIISTSIILIGIFIYIAASKNRSKWRNVTLALILAGAFGNFIDRIINFGDGAYVRDMIHVIIEFNGKEYFPYIFNVADMSLVIGACMLIFDLLFLDKDAIFKFKKKDEKKDDIVKISSDAHYYTGKQAPAWVTNKTWVVKSVKGNRIVIDKSEDGKHSICSPFDSKYLTVVKSATSDDVPPTSAFEPYLIRVTAEALNIRRGAGTNYKIVKTTTKDNIYTIVDEAMGEGATKWGLLKSYQNKRNGWISLDYVKKIKR